MLEKVRYLLLQIRDDDDPMRFHEVESFRRVLACDERQLTVVDLLSGVPSAAQLRAVDVVLLGGSGNYSVASEGQWLEQALDAMRSLYEIGKPTFASCWGFQAMARAMGGKVVTDLQRAEVGTLQLHVTAAGREDPLFAPLNPTFSAQMGHQDIVDTLPDDAIRLASTDRVTNQAFCFEARPIYCTQFHPELDRSGLLKRVHAYPQYIRDITGMTLDEFDAHCFETPETSALLPRFVRHVLA